MSSPRPWRVTGSGRRTSVTVILSLDASRRASTEEGRSARCRPGLPGHTFELLSGLDVANQEGRGSREEREAGPDAEENDRPDGPIMAVRTPAPKMSRPTGVARRRRERLGPVSVPRVRPSAVADLIEPDGGHLMPECGPDGHSEKQGRRERQGVSCCRLATSHLSARGLDSPVVSPVDELAVAADPSGGGPRSSAPWRLPRALARKKRQMPPAPGPGPACIPARRGGKASKPRARAGPDSLPPSDGGTKKRRSTTTGERPHVHD